jgi:tetratricopeptide (TPR) repeat protein
MKVYISSTKEAEEQAERLWKALREVGIEPLDAKGVWSSDPWADLTQQLVRSADAVVFLIGSSAEHRQWMQHEWDCALEISWAHPEKRLIPVLVGDAEIPAFLSQWHALRLSESPNDWKRFLNELIDALGNEAAPAAASGDELALARGRQESRLLALQHEANALRLSPSRLQAEVKELRRQFDRERNDRNPALAKTATHLADILRSLGEYKESLQFLQVALETFSIELGTVNPIVARTLVNVAHVLNSLGRPIEAREHLERARAIYEFDSRLSEPDSTIAESTQLQLAATLRELGDFAGATELLSAFEARSFRPPREGAGVGRATASPETRGGSDMSSEAAPPHVGPEEVQEGEGVS